MPGLTVHLLAWKTQRQEGQSGSGRLLGTSTCHLQEPPPLAELPGRRLTMEEKQEALPHKTLPSCPRFCLKVFYESTEMKLTLRCGIFFRDMCTRSEASFTLVWYNLTRPSRNHGFWTLPFVLSTFFWPHSVSVSARERNEAFGCMSTSFTLCLLGCILWDLVKTWV